MNDAFDNVCNLWKRQSWYSYKYIKTTGCYIHPVYHNRYLIVLLMLDIHIPSFIQPFNCFCTHQNSWEFHVTHISLTLFKNAHNVEPLVCSIVIICFLLLFQDIRFRVNMANIFNISIRFSNIKVSIII